MEDTKVPVESTRPPHLIEKLKEEELKENKKLNWKEIFREIFIIAFIVFGVVLPFRIYIAEPYMVDGRSMDPTFESGDYLIVDKISQKARNPERNSVVVFKYPQNPSKNFIKRIIGLPNETVIIKGDDVTIINKENPNGFSLEQNYVVHKSIQDAKVTLKDDEYFVMGDNRSDSFDSRYWGPLNKKYILGRPLIQLLPITKIETIPGNIDKNEK